VLQLGGLAALGIAGPTALPRQSASAQTPTPKSGGSFAFAYGGYPIQTLDPVAVFEFASAMATLSIYDQLLRIAADGKSLEPCLATSWEIAPDGLTYTFHLRQANFHDGTPCTSADVVYSLNRVMSDPATLYAFLFAAVSAVEAPDPQTVVIRLKTPWVPLLADLAFFGGSIISKAAHSAKQADYFEAPVGTGPFMIDAFVPETDAHFRKNPNYWDPGKPYLDAFSLILNLDDIDRLAKLRAGAFDAANDAPYAELPSLRADKSINVIEESVALTVFMILNTSRPPFDDKTLRQAVGYAIDKQKIIDAAIQGAGEVANTFLPNMLQYHDDSAPGYPYNLEKAQSLVATSAYAKGFDAELIVGPGDEVGKSIAALITADLAKIGGRITTTLYQDAMGRASNGDYDSELQAYGTDILDPDEATNFVAVGTGPWSAYYTFYDNPEIDKIAASAPMITNPTERAAAYAHIQQMFADDAPLIPLYYAKMHVAATPHIQNLHFLPTMMFRSWEVWRDDV
jgi:peptide/nickel transport system substrate-binding protein